MKPEESGRLHDWLRVDSETRQQILFCKYLLINSRLACRKIVNTKAFSPTLSRRSAILRRIASLLAVLVWGGLLFGGAEKAVADVLPINPSGQPVSAVVCEPFSDKTEITLAPTFGGLAIQPDGKIIAGTGMWGSFFDPESGVFGRFGRGAFRFNPWASDLYYQKNEHKNNHEHKTRLYLD